MGDPMRHVFLLMLAIVAIPNFLYASDALEFNKSEIHGLVNFVETISGNPHRSKSLKEYFEKSKHNTPEVNKKIDEFRDLVSDLDQTVQFPGYPDDRHMGINISQLFLIRSAYSKNLRDFQERTVGLVPMSLQARYLKSLEYFLPIYRALIWEPTSKKLDNHIAKMKQLGKTAKVSEMFDKAKTFYRSEWPTGAKFRLTMVPIPGAKGSAKSESLVAFESISVLVDSKEHEQKFSVIFHELCHSLFESQSKEFQKKFEESFRHADSPYARYAYHLMNEGLATALGNGWAYKRATGKMNPGSWYNHRYVEEYAKALYPTVEKYIDATKPIDDGFIKEAIEIFARTFPEAPRDLENLLTHVFLSADERVIPVKAASRLLHDKFNVWSMESYSLANPEKIKEGLSKGTNTAVVMISPTQHNLLEHLPKTFLETMGNPKDLFADGKDKIVTGTTKGGDVFVIVASTTRESIESALTLLKSKSKIEPSLNVIPIERAM